MQLNTDKLLTIAARFFGTCLLAAGSFYFWKFGIGPDPEDKSAATLFGATPILYGLLLVLISFRHDADRRKHLLVRMVGIPVAFAAVAFIAAIAFPSIK